MSLLFLLAAFACSGDPDPPEARRDLRPLTQAARTGDARVAVAQAMALTLEHPEVEDLWRDRPYRVDLFDDDGDGRPDRATLDADRDGNIEQRWSRVEGALMIETSPMDDGLYEPAVAWEGPAPTGSLGLPGRQGGDAP